MPLPFNYKIFEKLIASPTSGLCDKVLSSFGDYIRRLHEMFSYMYKDDGTLTDEFIEDLLGLPCAAGSGTVVDDETGTPIEISDEYGEPEYDWYQDENGNYQVSITPPKVPTGNPTPTLTVVSNPNGNPQVIYGPSQPPQNQIGPVQLPPGTPLQYIYDYPGRPPHVVNDVFDPLTESGSGNPTQDKCANLPSVSIAYVYWKYTQGLGSFPHIVVYAGNTNLWKQNGYSLYIERRINNGVWIKIGEVTWTKGTPYIEYNDVSLPFNEINQERLISYRLALGNAECKELGRLKWVATNKLNEKLKSLEQYFLLCYGRTKTPLVNVCETINTDESYNIDVYLRFYSDIHTDIYDWINDNISLHTWDNSEYKPVGFRLIIETEASYIRLGSDESETIFMPEETITADYIIPEDGFENSNPVYFSIGNFTFRKILGELSTPDYDRDIHKLISFRVVMLVTNVNNPGEYVVSNTLVDSQIPQLEIIWQGK